MPLQLGDITKYPLKINILPYLFTVLLVTQNIYGFLSAANPLILPTNEEPFFLYGKTCSDSLLIGNN